MKALQIFLHSDTSGLVSLRVLQFQRDRGYQEVHNAVFANLILDISHLVPLYLVLFERWDVLSLFLEFGTCFSELKIKTEILYYINYYCQIQIV